MTRLALRELEVGDEAAFRMAVAEFAASDPDWEFAFQFDARTDFAEYVDCLQRRRLGFDLPDGWVPNTFLVGTVGARIVGRVSLRHELNDFLLSIGGHIGFGVVASERRRGYGTELLRQALPVAQALGLPRVLVTCDDTNQGSRKVIESCGGVLEDTRFRADGGVTRRYWIALSDGLECEPQYRQ